MTDTPKIPTPTEPLVQAPNLISRTWWQFLDLLLRYVLSVNDSVTELASTNAVTPEDYGWLSTATQAANQAALETWAADTDRPDKTLRGHNYDLSEGLLFACPSELSGVSGSKFTLLSGATLQAVRCAGTLDALPALSADADEGDVTLTFSGAPTINDGDVVIIANPDTFSWSAWRDYHKAGEMVKVRTLAGSVADLMEVVRHTYASGDVNCWRLDHTQTFKISNLEIEDRAGVGCMFFDKLVGLRETNVKASGSHSIVFRLRCYDVVCVGASYATSLTSSSGYAVVNGASAHVRQQGYFASPRHAIAHGAGPYDGTHPVFDNVTHDSTVVSWTAVGAMDLGHSDTENCGAVNCTLIGGASMGGKDNYLIGNTILAEPDMQGGGLIICAEVVGGNITVKNNRFYSPFNPQTDGPGKSLIDFGSTGNLRERIKSTVNIDISGNTIVAPNHTGIAIVITVTDGGSPVLFPVNVAIKDNDFTGCPQIIEMVRYTDTGTITPSENIHLTGNMLVAGVRLASIDATAMDADTHLKFDTQTRRVTVSMTAGNDVASSSDITYRHALPVAKPFVKARLEGDATGASLFNNTRLMVDSFAVDADSAKVSVVRADGANFTATTNATVFIEVSVDGPYGSYS